jgi:glycosyltransferase involved in cell wall biosynthesis
LSRSPKAAGEEGASLPHASVAPIMSIVIPAYNVADFIADAVSSALDQTLRAIEVVVVNDGSTDRTGDVLQRIAVKRRDPRLVIVTRENGGLSTARNTGIANARGRYIGFLDGDDVWLPTKAQAHAAELDRDPRLGISFSCSEYITESGASTGRLQCAGKTSPDLDDMVRRNHVGNGSSAVVRRECFEAAGLFRPDLKSCEDWEMWCRILATGRFVSREVARPLVLYRMRSTSLSFSDTFLLNADRAVRLVSELPGVSSGSLNAGRAEHYRIAAWKAVQIGLRRTAMANLAKAYWLRPSLLFERRAAATAMAMILPTGLPGAVASRLSARRRRLRHPG